VLTLSRGLAQLRPYFTDENRDLFRVLLNATSAAEANLALQVLSPCVPERTLVTACNLREVLRGLPASPFPMRVDEQTLIRTANLEKHTATLGRTLPDGLEVVVTTAGNLVLDLIVRDGSTKYFGYRQTSGHCEGVVRGACDSCHPRRGREVRPRGGKCVPDAVQYAARPRRYAQS
jgi:hypothetical protein